MAVVVMFAINSLGECIRKYLFGVFLLFFLNPKKD